MHIILADAAKPAVSSAATRQEPHHAKYLISYAYRAGLNQVGGYGEIIRAHQSRGVRLLLDSGAFTAFTTGKTFTVDGYAEWVRMVQLEYGALLTAFDYLNLDVIGDQTATWKNQEALERMGLRPVPILTHTSHAQDLERILEYGYTYFALGGLVALRGDKPAVRQWLDSVYRRLMQHQEKTGVWIRTHLLGCTWEWLLERYPAYSSDSSTWLSPIRFGAKRGVSGLPYLPKSNERQDNSTLIHALRCEIRRYSLLERHLTSLWLARGVDWSVYDCPAH